MKKSLIFTATILILSFKSFGQNSKYQKEIDEANKWNSEQFKIVKKNFAFSTDCDTSKIKVSILQTQFEKDRHLYEDPNSMGRSKKMRARDEVKAQTLGVSGCDQKATYVLYMARAGF